LRQLCDRFVLARLGGLKSRSKRVVFAVRKLLEAGVALARPFRRFGVETFEGGDQDVDRAVETVEVEAVKAHRWSVGGQGGVMTPQPLDELEDVAIAPHPRREAVEIRERVIGI